MHLSKLGQAAGSFLLATNHDSAQRSLSSGVNYLVDWEEGLDLITGTK